MSRTRLRPRARVARAAIAFLGMSQLMGCYEYVPVAPTAVPRDAQVRARLTDPEISRLRLREIMPLTDQTVEGRVLYSDADGLGLRVPLYADFGSPYRRADLGQQIQIAIGGVVETRLRRLDRIRTGIVAGVGLAIFTSFVLDNVSGWFGSNREVYGPDKDGVM